MTFDINICRLTCIGQCMCFLMVGHRQAVTHTANLESPAQLTCVRLDCGRTWREAAHHSEFNMSASLTALLHRDCWFGTLGKQNTVLAKLLFCVFVSSFV